jgi:hypothetical protein
MTTKLKLITVVVTLIVVLIAFMNHFWIHSSKEKATSQDNEISTVKKTRDVPLSHAVQKTSIDSVIRSAFQSPIDIYGVVIDQDGKAVPGAIVDLTPNDTPWETSQSKIELTTDTAGKFSARELKGASMGVRAWKEGYLRYPPLGNTSSSVVLGYSDGKSDSGHRYTNPNSPLILKLHKIGKLEQLIHIEKKRWDLSLDGTPRIIALDTEEGHGDHRIEFGLWSDTRIRELPGNNSYTAFDWSFEVRVPGGGLVWDESDAKFEAPETGYKEKVRYEYTDTMPREKWKRARAGRYFVRFGDGSYGRIQFTIDAGSDRRSLYMQSWLSLKPGSRNLATENMIIKVIESEAPEGDSTDE